MLFIGADAYLNSQVCRQLHDRRRGSLHERSQGSYSLSTGHAAGRFYRMGNFLKISLTPLPD